MAKRKIIWTKKANIERKDILNFWIDHNKSKNYSIKLNKLFVENVNQIAETPTIGRETEFANVRVRIARSYLIFYEYSPKYIKILTVWDGVREENTLKLK